MKQEVFWCLKQIVQHLFVLEYLVWFVLLGCSNIGEVVDHFTDLVKHENGIENVIYELLPHAIVGHMAMSSRKS